MLLAVLCDLGPAQGIGHLMRCLALAEELAARGHEIAFVADADSVPFAAAQLQARGFRSLPPPADASGHAALLGELDPDLVVIDSYLLPLEVYDAVASHWPTVALVDGDPGGRRAHLYVDQNIGAERDDWPFPEGAARLAGLDCALLRDDVLALRPEHPRQQEHQPLRVFAFFGGTDAFGAGPVLAEGLVATGEPFDLTVVAPTPWEPPPTRKGQRISLIAPTDRLAAHVAEADVVVSAAGTSSWELLCLRAACGLVCVADNQVTSYQRVVGTGAVVGLGELATLRDDPAAAVPALSALLTDPGLRRRLRAAAGEAVDGQGRRRVADAALALVGSLPAPGLD